MNTTTDLSKIIITKQDLNEAINNAASQAAKTAIETYKKEKESTTYLTTAETAKELGCIVRTVLNYIHRGHRSGVKLNAIYNGKDYRVNRYELNRFKQQIESK